MASPFEVFRKPRPVGVASPSTLADGVIMPGPRFYPEPPKFSLQRIGRDTTTVLTAQGKRVTDYRRLYSSTWLPKEGETVLRAEVRPPEEDDLILPTGEVLVFFGKQEFVRQPLVNDQSPAARIELDGWIFAVETRTAMQNEVVNNYEYLCYRLPADDQTL